MQVRASSILFSRHPTKMSEEMSLMDGESGDEEGLVDYVDEPRNEGLIFTKDKKHQQGFLDARGGDSTTLWSVPAHKFQMGVSRVIAARSFAKRSELRIGIRERPLQTLLTSSRISTKPPQRNSNFVFVCCTRRYKWPGR
jgi:hypothetical protein